MTCVYLCVYRPEMPKRRSPGDGGLYPIRGGKLWRGVVDGGTDPEGKRIQHTVTARTQRACREKLDALKAEIAKNGRPSDKQVTVVDWSKTWLDTMVKPNLDPNTFTTYRAQVNRWIVPTIGRRKVHQLRPSDVAAVRAAIVAAGRSSATARQAHIVLRMMLAAAKAERLCDANVAEDMKSPKAAKSSRGAIPTEQAIAILHAAALLPGAEGSRWWFKLLSGQRQGEITGATIADLDLERGTYRVNWKLEEVTREHGCGGACGFTRASSCPDARWQIPDGFEMRHLEGRFCLTRPKSNTGRVVPLIPQLVEAIRRHLAATTDQPNPHGLIWRNPDGSPITKKQDGDQWRSLLLAAGVITAEENRPGGTRLTGHWARHTTVTVLAEFGVDFQLIGEIVGHSSEQVTQIYRHARDAEKRAAMDMLGGVWAEALGLPPGPQA